VEHKRICAHRLLPTRVNRIAGVQSWVWGPQPARELALPALVQEGQNREDATYWPD
jgi:hypothetical protein